MITNATANKTDIVCEAESIYTKFIIIIHNQSNYAEFNYDLLASIGRAQACILLKIIHNIYYVDLEYIQRPIERKKN